MAHLENKTSPPVSTEDQLAGIQETLSMIAITNLRLYDVMMSLLAEQNLTDAKDLAETHKNGQLRSELPWLSIETN